MMNDTDGPVRGKVVDQSGDSVTIRSNEGIDHVVSTNESFEKGESVVIRGDRIQRQIND